jgi:hypothetical protein
MAILPREKSPRAWSLASLGRSREALGVSPVSCALTGCFCLLSASYTSHPEPCKFLFFGGTGA